MYYSLGSLQGAYMWDYKGEYKGMLGIESMSHVGFRFEGIACWLRHIMSFASVHIPKKTQLLRNPQVRSRSGSANELDGAKLDSKAGLAAETGAVASSIAKFQERKSPSPAPKAEARACRPGSVDSPSKARPEDAEMPTTTPDVPSAPAASDAIKTADAQGAQAASTPSIASKVPSLPLNSRSRSGSTAGKPAVKPACKPKPASNWVAIKEFEMSYHTGCIYIYIHRYSN